MSESSDYDQGDYTGVDFSSARKEFDKRSGRSYRDAIKSKKPLTAVKADSVYTSCSSPLVIVADETGSMGKWAAPIFAKLGYLVNEGQVYLGNDMEISFCAVGDAYSDDYPLQPRPFAKGLELSERLKELIIERRGGGNKGESYELPALYYANKCLTPNAIRKPIIIFIGDDVPHELVSRDQAKKIVGVNLEYEMSARDAFEELKEKFSVFMILKPPKANAGENDARNRAVYDRWVGLLGDSNVKVLTDANRVVDVIFGILAEITNRNDAFRDDMENRQTPAQRKTVYKSLGLNSDGTPKIKSVSPGIKKPATVPNGGKSVLRVPATRKPGRLF